jgi:Cu(I)/Ag(I) efflux system membrane fusion protein
MNRKQFIKDIGITIIASMLFLTACKDKTTTVTADAKVQTYTCPMHPQIVQNKPGTCPICGMDLVLFDKTNTDPSLTLGTNQQALANITTMVVGTNEFSNSTRLNGRLAINPEQTNFISSRVPGRIEFLFVIETGIQVRKGQALYKIYSEELSTLQQEYLLTTAQAANFPDEKRFQEIAKAAKHKLLLYGQAEGQLQQLVKSQKLSPYVTYFSPGTGIVAELSVKEGQ